MSSMTIRNFYLALIILFQVSCGSTPKLGEKEAWDKAADAIRMSKMSPEELRWENKLLKHLNKYELGIYKNLKLQNKQSAFDYVEDNPKLPRVLLIGDNLSTRYTIKIRNKLSGIANVHRIPEVAGTSSDGAENIKRWVNLEKWDLIHFNFGLIDAERETTLSEYGNNLRSILRVLKQTKAKLIWSNTSPSKPRRRSIQLNKISEKIMKANNVYINDVYNAELPFINDDQKITEWLSDDGVDTIASKIANAIKEQLFP